jgi:uncharacterized membrane protein YccF (DUF307 family)
MSTTAPVVQPQESGPGLVLRAIWFVVIGWWLGQIALFAGWFFTMLVITLPLGLYILNRLPQITTLRSPTQEWTTQEADDGSTVVRAVEQPQRNLLLRSVYFVAIGWWASFIWLEIAWVCGITIVLLPLSFWMFSKSAAVMTLRRT